MAECPDCGNYTHGRVCACGWTATPIAPVTGVSPDPEKCATCALIFEARKKYRPGDVSVPANHCYGCGTHDHGVGPFTLDTPCIPDRGMRVCSACMFPMLRRRSTCSHEWAAGKRNGEHCERCELEITGNRELFREYMRQMAERAVSL